MRRASISAPQDDQNSSCSGSDSEDELKDEKQKLKKKSRRKAASSRSSVVGGKRAQDADAPMKVLTAKQEQNDTSVNYHIDRKCTIESDGKDHKITIKVITLPATFEYVCVPSKSNKAFLRASMLNDTGDHLLEGKMNVFMENFFITSSNFKATIPGEPIKIYLGPDPAIYVGTRPTGGKDKESGLIQAWRKGHITIKHVTYIKNNKTEKISVALFEQLPFSQTEKIRVQQETSREKATIDSYSLLCWEFTLDAGEEKPIALQYSVTHPKDQPVVGVEQSGVKGEMRL